VPTEDFESQFLVGRVGAKEADLTRCIRFEVLKVPLDRSNIAVQIFQLATAKNCFSVEVKSVRYVKKQ
jgi:hypothetical protein